MDKNTRFSIRISTDLYEWVKGYAQRMNTSVSALVKEYLESLRTTQESPPDMPVDAQTDVPLERADFERQHLTERVEEKTNQILYLRDLISEKDEQIDRFQQLLAMQSKNTAALTEQLETGRRMIEDQRRRKPSVWKRVFRWT